MVGGVEYLKVDDAGLHTRVNGEPRLFEVDTVIVCAGQLPLRTLYDELLARREGTLVGGAFEASELDAKRAIDQASRLAGGVRPSAISRACSHGRPMNCQADSATMVSISVVEIHLIRRGRARWASQSRTMGPRKRCCVSQRCSRGEARAKHAAASSTKGVVGRPGNTTPISPRPSARRPAATSKAWRSEGRLRV
jgi:hypothetical protein